MEDTDEKRAREYVMIFPYMAKGHTIPLLHLSSALSVRGIAVTVVTTPLNSSFLRESLPPDAHPNVDFIVLPFPRHPSLPEDCESTDQLPSPDLFPVFLGATELLRDPFRELLRRLSESSSLPLCVISDFFLGWTLDECRLFHLPRVVFHGMAVFAMLLSKSITATKARLAAGGEETFHLPGTPPALLLTGSDVPDSLREFGSSCDPLLPLVLKNEQADVASWGFLVNSFLELDGDYVPYLEGYYRSSGARASLVGPLCLRHRPTAVVSGEQHPCLEWLDKRPAKSVLYVSFGTQAHVSAEQMEEVLQGLQMSGHEFLLAARTQVAAPPDVGLVVNGWAPQREVLMHPSTGGFLSHCGWNSTLESLSAGVPILAWPMIAEQTLNARLVVGELDAGLLVSAGHGELIGREKICELVKELMGGGENGKRVTKKAEELGKMAKEAVADGGSSDYALTQFVQEIRRVTKERLHTT